MTDDISPEARRLLEKIVPPPYSPPQLYLELARNEAVVRSFIEGPIAGLRGLMHTGQVTQGDRELCILRVTARKRAAHEWGVHVAYLGRTSGLSPSQVEATATDAAPAPAWNARQRAVLAIADAVADCREFTMDESGLVESELSPADRIEFVALASLYLGIAAMCRVLRVPVEPGTPTLPGCTTPAGS
ncbi:MAG TPA: carboxymuconolactone decarboxylase family protein [Steroidobacteraceae bacterium]|nr:carboxymuconolactone decarboxylase family protein [Steroidobacteraceae bacterium]